MGSPFEFSITDYPLPICFNELAGKNYKEFYKQLKSQFFECKNRTNRDMRVYFGY